MRKRGEKYWEWIDSQQHSRCHAEELSNGTEFDVEVRLSTMGAIQVFIGLYKKDGEAIIEEYEKRSNAESLSEALLSGVDRARGLATALDPSGSSGQHRKF